MSWALRSGTLLAASLAGTCAVFACAGEGASEPAPLPASDATADTEGDAQGELDASTDAGPCVDSGVCTVVAPIDRRINITSIWGSGPKDVWAVGTNRTVLHFDGTTWEQAELEVTQPFTMHSVWASSATDVWIADGPLLRHTNGWKGPSATEWEAVALPAVAVPWAIAGRNGHVLVGRLLTGRFDSAAALITANGWGDAGPRGVTEVAVPFTDSPTGGIWALAATRSDEAWAVSVGTEYRPGARVARLSFEELPDAGVDGEPTHAWGFEEYDGRTSKNLFGVWGNEDVVWLVGEGGTVRRMPRAKVPSRVFEVHDSRVLSDLRAVFGFAEDDLWAVGDDATVLHFDGAAWSRVATPLDGESSKPRLMSIWGSAPGDIWIGGHGIMLHVDGAPR